MWLQQLVSHRYWLFQVYMLSLSSQPVDHEEPGKQMVLGDQVSFGARDIPAAFILRGVVVYTL